MEFDDVTILTANYRQSAVALHIHPDWLDEDWLEQRRLVMSE